MVLGGSSALEQRVVGLNTGCLLGNAPKASRPQPSAGAMENLTTGLSLGYLRQW